MLNVAKLLARKQKRCCNMNPLNMNLLNAIVSYKDCFYYIDKLYKTNGVYDGVVAEQHCYRCGKGFIKVNGV